GSGGPPRPGGAGNGGRWGLHQRGDGGHGRWLGVRPDPERDRPGPRVAPVRPRPGRGAAAGRGRASPGDRVTTPPTMAISRIGSTRPSLICAESPDVSAMVLNL